MLGGNDASRSGRTAAEKEAAAAAALLAQSCRDVGGRGRRATRVERPEPQRYGGPAGSRRLLRSSAGRRGAWRAPCGSETSPRCCSRRCSDRTRDRGSCLCSGRIGKTSWLLCTCFLEIRLWEHSLSVPRVTKTPWLNLNYAGFPPAAPDLKLRSQAHEIAVGTEPSDCPSEDSLLGKVSKKSVEKDSEIFHLSVE